MVIPQKRHKLSINKVENMVKFYVPTWPFFAGPVTYINGIACAIPFILFIV